MIVVLPFLFCCCVWPSNYFLFILEKYPKCKKIKNIIYDSSNSTTDYRIHSLIVGCLCLIVIIGSIMGLSKGTDIVDYYNNVGCKMATFFDDLFNGKMSTK